MLVSTVTELRRCGSPRAVLASGPDREMRCERCRGRVFTSLAPQLVSADAECGRCGAGMTLVPAPDLPN